MAGKALETIGQVLPRIALLVGIAGIVTAAVLLIVREETRSMRAIRTSSKTEISLPPIDLRTPAETKTATFAMG
jgi:hypothetical protein